MQPAPTSPRRHVRRLARGTTLLASAQNTAVSSTGRMAPLENRCGWFHNPTPGNATLTDRDGEWVIATQGGTSVEGDWPVFADAQWTKTNGHYGHDCACMKVVVDRREQRVLRIASATAKPLKVCREDRALPASVAVRWMVDGRGHPGDSDTCKAHACDGVFLLRRL